MTTTAHPAETTTSTRAEVSVRTALVAGAVAGLLAAVLNVIVATTARAVFDVSDDFMPLTPGPVVMWTVLGVIVGALGWRLIVNKSSDSGALLRRLVPTVLVLSFIPDVALLVSDAMPGTTTAAVLSLMVMHVITAAVAVVAYRRAMPPASPTADR